MSLGQLSEQLRELGDDELVAEFRRRELERRRTEAELAAVVAEAERRKVHRSDGHRHTRNWLRAEANWSGAQVIRMRRLAELVTELPAVGTALHSGHIGIAQAEELARAAANPRCGDQLGDAAALLLDQCEQLPFDDARACIRRWETLADLDGAHRDRQRSQERRVAFVGEHDGGVVVTASGGSAMDAAEMTAVFEAFLEIEFRNDVAERTRLHGPDAPASLLPRTDAQRRFDALQAMFRAAAANPTVSPPVPIVVNLIVDHRTFHDAGVDHGLIDPDDPDTPPVPVERRCETASGVPLLPEDALRGALTGHIRRIVLDGASAVIDVGRKRRLFTGVAREVAKLLARHCESLGCTVSARFAQIDHLTEWSDGEGPTDLANAGVGCGRDNRRKHRLGLRAERRPDGLLNWYRRNGTEMRPVGRRHVADHAETDAAIRRRVDELGSLDAA